MMHIRALHSHQIIHISIIAILIILGMFKWQYAILTEQQGGVDMADQLMIYDALSQDYIPYVDSEYPGTLAETTYRFKLTLTSIAPGSILEIAKPQLASVHITSKSLDDTVTNDIYLGRDYDFKDQIIQYRNLATALKPTPEASTLYLDVETNTYLQLPLFLWSQESFMNHVFMEQLLTGLFYGMILVMILYNAFLGVFLKDIRYLYYVLLLLSYMGLQMVWDGTGYVYLWPNHAQWDRLANPLFINLSALFLLAFTASFLRVKEMKNKLHILYKGITAFSILSTFVILLIPSNLTIYLAMFIALLTVIFIVMTLIATKLQRPAEIIFLSAFELFIIGNLLNIFAGFGLLPYTFYTHLAPKAGFILLIVLASLALGDRLREAEIQKGLLSERANVLKELQELGTSIVSSNDVSKVARNVIDKFTELSGHSTGHLLLLEDGNDTDLICYYGNGTSWPISLSNSELSYLLEQLRDPHIKQLDNDHFEYLNLGKKVSLLLVPLMNLDMPIGAILLSEQQVAINPPENMRLLSDYATQVTMIIGNIKIHEEILKHAHTDELTNVHNRRGIFSILKKYYEDRYKHMPLSLLMIDIDNFKKFNDTYGHTTGDELLRMVSSTMDQYFHGIGEVGRYGGEEFIVILPNISVQNALKHAEKIRSIIADQHYIDTHSRSLKVTVSIGVSSRHSLADGAYEVCDRADQGLYEAKEKGKNQVVNFHITGHPLIP